MEASKEAADATIEHLLAQVAVVAAIQLRDVVGVVGSELKAALVDDDFECSVGGCVDEQPGIEVDVGG